MGLPSSRVQLYCTSTCTCTTIVDYKVQMSVPVVHMYSQVMILFNCTLPLKTRTSTWLDIRQQSAYYMRPELSADAITMHMYVVHRLHSMNQLHSVNESCT